MPEQPDIADVLPWHEIELELTSQDEIPDGYTAVRVRAEFSTGGRTWRRPGFWDGGRIWRVRFAPPEGPATWTWSVTTEPNVPSLNASGTFSSRAPSPEQHGFWRMSPQGRALVHADGTPALLVADTAWALPWRASTEQVLEYARDRAAKGFNAVLLMSVQPDMDAVGPGDRTADEGFDVGFKDLADGHLNDLRPEYFQYLDSLVDILLEHGITPVWQPVFQGFGWKGLRTAGTVVPPPEYARYCRYLVARYGARPAVYLVGADLLGRDPQSEAGGREIEATDCYRQPTGLHYAPHATNREHQSAAWLDFQWCQTGHGGEHVPQRVADMYRNRPVKAVANGEPTYESAGSAEMAAGWWQGHEAWSNLCAGGTMGVVYGAANIWQWKLHPDEPGHAPWALAPEGGWRESLRLPGSGFVGLLGRILAGLPTTDMEPDWSSFSTPHAVRVPGVLSIVYQEEGRQLSSVRADVPPRYTVFDPMTGNVVATGEHHGPGTVLEAAPGPRVVIFS